MDGEKHIKFKQWSVSDKEGDSKSLKKLVFSNDTKADMTFNFTIDGPFSIVKSKSNTGAKHPMALGSTASKVLSQKVDTAFCL